MVFGTMHTQKITVPAGAAVDQDIDTVCSTEKLIKFVPSATGIHLLLTPKSSTHAADASDYLLPTTGDGFLVGRGLDRITLFNTTGGELSVYVAIFY